MLAIRPFRRLLVVNYLCSTADWLSLLALSSFAKELAPGQLAFTFSSVVLVQMLPGLLFAPIGGLLADRFDRRKVMVVCDLLRFGLLISIALVGDPVWLYVGTFLVGCCSMLWIPAKDAAVPNLLTRPEQVETAGQLGLVMTWGVTVISGATLFAAITGVNTWLHLPAQEFGRLYLLQVALAINGLFFLTSAVLVATRIPELSRRGTATGTTATEPSQGIRAMLRDGARFVRDTPLVRGLLLGMAGAFAAGGAVVGSAQSYALSLGGGDATFGLLLAAVFLGLASGMAAAPRLARRLARGRLFGVAIVAAGVALVVVALSPHLALSLAAAVVVGGCAGAAFLTGMTIIGLEIEDAIRGRINALYQLLLKVVVAGAAALAPVLVALLQPTSIRSWGAELTVDGTRPVLLGAGLLALATGVLAYRRLNDRQSGRLLADLRSALGRGRRMKGLLIAVEGTTAADTARQAALLADWLRTGPRVVVLAADPALDDERMSGLLDAAALTGARAQALAAAAVRADVVEKVVRPALDAGAVVVMEQFACSPMTRLPAVAELDTEELDGLAGWAIGTLRPDVSVLLDADPGDSPKHEWRIVTLLAELAGSTPERYLVVDGAGADDEVAERVRLALRALPVARERGRNQVLPGKAAEPASV
ncbi:MFS transporter [Amycolatopsis nigrescens]|uniref:bifunctional MFS transporter/dTMP kinase n=1 Tax=Amycolatopsis nigrescens TaxID=381445 RepID=UPI00036786D5